MMKRRSLLAIAFASAFATFAAAGTASAQCPPDCSLKGGGDAVNDCYAEIGGPDHVKLNSPFFNPAKPKAPKELRCLDGDNCDLDGLANNSCTFNVDLCLRNADPSLPTCAPQDVTAVEISGKAVGLEALQTAVDALLPATTNVCTVGQNITVPLKAGSTGFKITKASFKVTATAGTEDDDSYKFVCVPRGWPSHGYDNANTRATPVESTITAANVTQLAPKWTFVPETLSAAQQPSGRTISSTVTLGSKLMYTSSWNGRVYAVDKKSGKEKWTFDTGSKDVLGVQSSVTVLADGRVLVADSLGQLFCLDGKKGTELWSVNAGSADPAAAHAWGSPTVANGRVFIGIASHNDAPCTRGVLVAYDLDTGVELWRRHTVPERICFDDTTNECSSNAECVGTGSPCLLGNCDSNPDTVCATNSDCPATFITAGTCVAPGASTGECWLERSISCTTDNDCPACVPGKGGGVTATAATSFDGEEVYMASVGCLSFPSIGNSDAMFKLDAETGAVDWVYRTEAVEQFQSFPVDDGPTYHDYGFLNGPILATIPVGMLSTAPVAVGGGKDGTLYAVNRDTGLLQWSNPLAPAPTFAGFGLFNGSLAYDLETEQFFASLYTSPTYAGTDKTLAFRAVDGGINWGETAPDSWTSATVANGLLYTADLGTSTLKIHNATTGALLHTLSVPSGNVLGGVAVENGVVYVPFGQVNLAPSAQGGVAAFAIPEE